MTEPFDYTAYSETVLAVRILQPGKPDSEQWRSGQTYFNVLYDIRPDLADLIRATELDPFHDDSRIGVFLAWLAMQEIHEKNQDDV